MLKQSFVLRLLLLALVSTLIGAGLMLAWESRKLKKATVSPSSLPKEVPFLSRPSATPGPRIATYSGVLKPLGPSTVMEGTHFLEDSSGQMLVILRGGKVDSSFLNLLEGQVVEVVGRLKEAVEGGKQLLIVDEVHF